MDRREERAAVIGAAEPQTVAVLCAQNRSVYRLIGGVEIYDQTRDARTFPGGVPVVAHPPCRAWSAYCAHQSKPAVGEKELGLWCADQVRQCGGILEKPAHSRLFEAARLPLPGWAARGDSWSIEVMQVWWGFPQLKKTWLYFSKINPAQVNWPLRLHGQGGDKRTWQLLSKESRSRTPLPMAQWLVDHARKAGVLNPDSASRCA